MTRQYGIFVIESQNEDRRVATLFTGGLADGVYHEFKVKVYICVVTYDLIQ